MPPAAPGGRRSACDSTGSASDSDFTSRSRRHARIGRRRSDPETPIWQLKIASNFSIHCLPELVAKFTSVQRRIVVDSGFSFVMHLPAGYKIVRPFAVWLLSHLMKRPSGLVLTGLGEIAVGKAEVLDILGIPGGEKPVVAARSMRRATATFGGFQLSSSVRKALNVIGAIAGCEDMRPDEERAFLAAIVIYSVGRFLAPTGRNGGEVDDAVVEAVMDDGGIRLYDWQGYVLGRLAEAGEQVRAQIQQGCPGGQIITSGCTLFLVMLYYSRCSGVRFPDRVAGGPLIACFNSRELKALDKVDQVRRQESRSWRVLNGKKLDCKAFIRILSQMEKEAEDRAARRAALEMTQEQYHNDEAANGRTQVGAVEKVPSATTQDGMISIVHKHFGEMLENISSEVISKHGDMFLGAASTVLNTVLHGNESVLRQVFEAIQLQIVQLEAEWFGGQTSGLGATSTTANATQGIAEWKAIFETPKPTHCGLRGTTDDLSKTRYEYVGRKLILAATEDSHEHCSPGLNCNEHGALSDQLIIRDDLKGKALAEDAHFDTAVTIDAGPVFDDSGPQKGPLIHGVERPVRYPDDKGVNWEEHSRFISKCKKRKLGHMQTDLELSPAYYKHSDGMNGLIGEGPIFDNSQSHEGTGRRHVGMELLVRAADAVGVVSNDGELEGLMSNVEVSHSMYWDQFAGGSEPRKSDKGFKTPMAWYKPRELMLKAFVPNVAEVLSLRSALECKGISSVILNRVWVHFGSPVHIDLRADEIMNHFVLAHPYTPKMMAAIIALYKELDDKLHTMVQGPRWRFFVDPRLMADCLSGHYEYEIGESCGLMEKPYLRFQPSDCEMGIVPVQVYGTWVCFAIHLTEQKVTVFHPVQENLRRWIGEEHLRKMSLKILNFVLPMVWTGASAQYAPPSQWAVESFDWHGLDVTSDEQGPAVAMFSFFFDGKSLCTEMLKQFCSSGTPPIPNKRMGGGFKWSLCALLLGRDENPIGLKDITLP